MLNSTDLGSLMTVVVSPMAGGAGAASAEGPWWVVSLCVAGGLLLGFVVALLSNKVGYWMLRHQSKSAAVALVFYVVSPWAFLLAALLGLFSLAQWSARSVAA